MTAGSVENRNSRETVWTMPDGPGLHFAYVTVYDGRGGYADLVSAMSRLLARLAEEIAAEINRLAR